jgi:hypothetical protein
LEKLRSHLVLKLGGAKFSDLEGPVPLLFSKFAKFLLEFCVPICILVLDRRSLLFVVFELFLEPRSIRLVTLEFVMLVKLRVNARRMGG